MTWAAFLKSPSFKYGALFGTLGFGAGAGASAAIALKIASLCTKAVNSFITEMGTNITISELSGVVHIGGFNISLTLEDITAALPAGWMDLVNHATELPHYCFSAPFTVGMCITTAAALSLASAVALAIHLRDHQAHADREDDLEMRDGYLGIQ